jgi:signal transduction histidine kinase
MDLSVPATAASELAAAYLQLAVTLGLTALCLALHARYYKPYFGLWALAGGVFALRLISIISFFHTEHFLWLYWHQVTTGWTALALLWAALVFSRGSQWRPWYLAIALFPPLWSYWAIFRMDHFLWAAGPAVAFLSLATAWTAWAFFRYHREVGSTAAKILAITFAVWALHHLDYPFLRARGAWNPWGYYLDITFELGMGLGILLLVVEDLDQGLRTLTALSGELQSKGKGNEAIPEAVLRRALGLRGVHGSALYLRSSIGGRFLHGAGVCALWPYEEPSEQARRAVESVRRTGQPQVIQGLPAEAGVRRRGYEYTAAIPVLRGDVVEGALVVVGQARDPFTVLDAPFLVAFGQQVGAALENEDLYQSLTDRTEELERLQARMIRQHEDERNRLTRELHDETAQVLAALNMQLGLLQEKGDETMEPGFERAKALVGEGIRSIRAVTRNLRPTLLDDLGLVPALRALARDFGTQNPLEIRFKGPAEVVGLSADAELALYRTLQEGLANTVRHGQCDKIDAEVLQEGDAVTLSVTDNGVGFPDGDNVRVNRTSGGLAGIRERITGVGGTFEIGNGQAGGARIFVRVPRVQREEGESS